MRDLAVGEVG